MSDDQDKLKLSVQRPTLFGRKKASEPAQEVVEPEVVEPEPAQEVVEPEPAQEVVEPEVVEPSAVPDVPEAHLDPYRAAALTGLVVGAAMVVLTWVSLRGCEAVRGTTSCGGGTGFLLLAATFVLCILLGSALLRAFAVADPGSSSFLAVALVAVVALLVLIDLLDSWSMLVVIPLLTVAAYVGSVWVTRTFVEPSDA